MKILEILQQNKQLLETLRVNNIKISDIKYVPIIEELERLDKSGEKRAFIISSLAEKYKVSERSIYLAVQKLAK